MKLFSTTDVAVKPCKKCGVEKDLREFYKHPDCKDGRANTCAACTKARVSAWRTSNPSKASAAELRRRQANPGYNRSWKKANPEKVKVSRRREWRKDIDTVSDRYLRRRWRALRNATPEELAVYRETLVVKREYQSFKKFITEVENAIEKTD